MVFQDLIADVSAKVETRYPASEFTDDISTPAWFLGTRKVQIENRGDAEVDVLYVDIDRVDRKTEPLTEESRDRIAAQTLAFLDGAGDLDRPPHA